MILFNHSFVGLPLQKALQRLIGGPVTVRIEYRCGRLAGYRLDCWSSEKYFVLGDQFEQRIQTALTEFVKPGDIVYDVGSHVGFMALFLASLCGPRVAVFAFEPSPHNFQRLQGNVLLNRMTNIEQVNFAVSDREGALLLTEDGSTSHILQGSELRSAEISQVRAIRLDDFVYRDGNPPPNFIKLDVEGHAGKCLVGSERLLRDVAPLILFEIHDTLESRDIRDVLDRFNYHVRPLSSLNRFPNYGIAFPG